MTRVLVVEDEMLVALDLQATLEELGFGPVDLASCMETAIQAAGNDRGSAPDLALVDVNLADGPTGPVIGTHLAKAFGTSVLFLTANPQMAQSAEAGLGILSKPIDRTGIAAATAYAIAARTGKALPPPPGLLPLSCGSAA